MAIGTPVQRKSVLLSAQTSTSAVVPTTTVAAGTLAVMLLHSGQSKIASSVTDSVGNTWTVDATGNGGTGTSYISFASCQVVTQITSSDTITVTWSSSTSANCEAWVYEVSSAATSSAFDKSSFQYQTTVAISSGTTATLSQADEVVFGVAKVGAGSRTFTKEASYSESANPLRGSTTSVAYKVVAATTAVSFSGTWSGVDGTAAPAGVATYKGLPSSVNVTVTPAAATAAGSGPVPVPNLAVSGQALAAGRAETPLPSLSVSGQAVAAGRADTPVPTISVTALATATGTALSPEPAIAANAVVAIAVGAPPVPVPTISVTAVATATGTSPSPVVDIQEITIVTAVAARAVAASGSVSDYGAEVLPGDGVVPEDTLYPGDGIAGRTVEVHAGISVTGQAVAAGRAIAPTASTSLNVIISPEPARARTSIVVSDSGWGSEWGTDWGGGTTTLTPVPTPGITVTGQAVAAGRAIVPTVLAITTDVYPTGTITPTGTLALAVFIHLGGQVTPRGRLCKQWPFPVWTDITDDSLSLTGINDASLSLSSVVDASLSLSAVTDTSLTLTGIDDTTLTPTVVTEECS